MKFYSSVKVREIGKNIQVRIASVSVPEIDEHILIKWQNWLDLIARLANIPAALIKKLNEDNIEVFLKSNSTGNPYHTNEKTLLGNGLYCENVIGTQHKLLLADATANPVWRKNNPDLDLNMISYLGYPINWPGGEVFGTICILDNKKNLYKNDINDLLFNLKQNIESDLELLISKQLISESEEKFRTLFNLSTMSIAFTDYATGRIIDFNDNLPEITGYKKSDILNKTTVGLEFLDQVTREKILLEIQNKGIAESIEVSFPTPAKEVMHFLLFSKKITLKGKEKLITTLLDITSIKKRELEIRKFSTAIEKIASTIIITNANGEIEYVNEYFTELTGFSKAEVLGKKPGIWKTNFHPDSYYKNLWTTIKQGKIWKGEFYNRKKNGDFYWEYATIAPVFDGNSDIIIHFVASKLDITENKRQLETLLESEKILRELNATKNKFFSIIGHDLMDPFNALLGFSRLLNEALEKNEKSDSLEFAQYIQQSAQNIFTLLQNLLIWTRTQSGKINCHPEIVDIEEMICNTLSALKPNALNKEIEIRLDIEKNIKAIIDDNMISTVLRNLVMNAIKFTRKGGTVIIKANIRNNNLNFSVSDTGIAIDEKHINQLFSLGKSFTTKGTNDETGTGLGLVICKEFIDIHNGRIWVESTPGKGSTFYFSIPARLD
ncbi:MAG: PAS domain-containing sensor histidine kinase [Mariniphaga sp.]|nr:PAS domain-containing sensor histidine kinase [Mariniphaga sp.]